MQTENAEQILEHVIENTPALGKQKTKVRKVIMREQGVGGYYIPVDDTSDEEENVFENVKKNYEAKYSDYYEFLANSESIRPICIAEDVDFKNMSFGKRICWWIGTFFKVLSILEYV